LTCKDGDLLLLDVGAGLGNYASDLTRTIPVRKWPPSCRARQRRSCGQNANKLPPKSVLI
jgi:Xaa-Pro aminopeptidase